MSFQLIHCTRCLQLLCKKSYLQNIGATTTRLEREYTNKSALKSDIKFEFILYYVCSKIYNAELRLYVCDDGGAISLNIGYTCIQIKQTNKPAQNICIEVYAVVVSVVVFAIK